MSFLWSLLSFSSLFIFRHNFFFILFLVFLLSSCPFIFSSLSKYVKVERTLRSELGNSGIQVNYFFSVDNLFTLSRVICIFLQSFISHLFDFVLFCIILSTYLISFTFCRFDYNFFIPSFSQLGGSCTYVDCTVTVTGRTALRALEGKMVTATCSSVIPHPTLSSTIISHTRYVLYVTSFLRDIFIFDSHLFLFLFSLEF